MIKTLLKYFSFLVLLCIWVTPLRAQQSSITTATVPHLGDTMPNFQFVLADGRNVVETKSIQNGLPTVFVFFSPECSHCKVLLRSIATQASFFDSVNLCVLSAALPQEALWQFAKELHLVDLAFMTIAMDAQSDFVSYFSLSQVPAAFYYDKYKVLRRVDLKPENFNSIKQLCQNKL